MITRIISTLLANFLTAQMVSFRTAPLTISTQMSALF